MSQLALYSGNRPVLCLSTPLSRPQSNIYYKHKDLPNMLLRISQNFSVLIMLRPRLHASHYACDILRYEQPRCKNCLNVILEYLRYENRSRFAWFYLCILVYSECSIRAYWAFSVPCTLILVLFSRVKNFEVE